MRRAMLKLIISLLFSTSLLFTTRMFAAETGSITGTVLDEKGNPVSGAKVHVMPADRPFKGIKKFFETDDRGEFKIGNLSYGEYRVFAEKREDGYADMGWAFFSNNVFPTAILSSMNPTADVLVRVPPKAGTLKCSVTDAATGQLLDPQVTLRRAENPNYFFSARTEPKFNVLVPSGVPVLVEISAPGYLPWRHPRNVKLEPGESLQLDVKLYPKPADKQPADKK